MPRTVKGRRDILNDGSQRRQVGICLRRDVGPGIPILPILIDAGFHAC